MWRCWGQGLAGLSAARDLKRSGADVIVLEARDRVGWPRRGGDAARRAQWSRPAARCSGRVTPPTASLSKSSAWLSSRATSSDPGEISWGLVDGVYVGDEVPWMSEAERRDDERIGRAFVELAATVDPDDPWGHPDAARLDALSLAGWLREQDALPAVHRRHELASLSLACDSPERTSLLAELRKHAVLGGEGFYDLERWEGLRVAEGAAEVALAMAAELDTQIRYGGPRSPGRGQRRSDARDARRRRDDRRRGGRVHDSPPARCGRSRSPA